VESQNHHRSLSAPRAHPRSRENQRKLCHTTLVYQAKFTHPAYPDPTSCAPDVSCAHDQFAHLAVVQVHLSLTRSDTWSTAPDQCPISPRPVRLRRLAVPLNPVLQIPTPKRIPPPLHRIAIPLKHPQSSPIPLICSDAFAHDLRPRPTCSAHASLAKSFQKSARNKPHGPRRQSREGFLLSLAPTIAFWKLGCPPASSRRGGRKSRASLAFREGCSARTEGFRSGRQPGLATRIWRHACLPRRVGPRLAGGECHPTGLCDKAEIAAFGHEASDRLKEGGLADLP
jgi:hypothetical protein